MKRTLIFTWLLALAACLTVQAVDIPQGTFYFDNSLTNYQTVKFVYGDDSGYSRVTTMVNKGNGRWSVTIPATVTGMYRYCFAATALPDGDRNESFTATKDYITAQGEMRTATVDYEIPVGWVFTPTSGDNWAQGTWVNPSANGYSGTLPVLFINTENGAEIVSKEEYLNATYYLDPMGVEGVEAIGSADNQLVTQIKGRGNYTWKDFDKKPYRLKLDKKQKLLGMSKSKHWALLAHADDQLAFLRNTVGFELSRRLGLAWTPGQQPVELVLNGKYWGLYMLTELIKIDPERINITEQEDNETDPLNVTGGWVVEIDNYEEDAQVRITEGNGAAIRFTYKSPEVLSTVQSDYLTNLVTAADAAIYAQDKQDNSWENIIDIDALVKFYIVQEMLDNAESFHGSCYWHKDQGENSKIVFGPVWDFGNSFRRGDGRFIYDASPFGQTWIGEIAKFPHFQEVLKEYWQRFLAYKYNGVDAVIDDFVSQIAAAALSDAARWPQYAHNNINNEKSQFKSRLNNRVNWLIEQWGKPDMTVLRYDVDGNGTVNGSDVTALYNVLLADAVVAGNADVDGNGVVNGADVTALYNYLLGDTGGSGGGETDNMITIKVQADVAPHLYAWVVDGRNATPVNGDWPGTEMTETVTEKGITWFVTKLDYDTVNIIFNNSGWGDGNQTEDIVNVGRGVHYYTWDGGSGYADVTSQYK